VTSVVALTAVEPRRVAMLPRAVRRSRSMGGELGVHVAVRDTAALARADLDAIRIGQRTWRLLHYVTFLTFVGATAHGIMSGSDSGTAWAWLIYVVATGIVVFLTGYRVVTGVQASRQRALRAVPVARPATGLDPVPVPAFAPLDLRAPHRPPVGSRDDALRGG
jgi:hypothetical protein